MKRTGPEGTLCDKKGLSSTLAPVSFEPLTSFVDCKVGGLGGCVKPVGRSGPNVLAFLVEPLLRSMNRLLSLSVPLLLASQSPRRRALLEKIGVGFSVQASPADETLDEPLAPRQMARALATKKAKPVAATHTTALILAADTVVIHENDVLEKPTSSDHARRMLRRLSDSSHTVYTGMALHHDDSDRAIVTGRATEVSFAPLTDEEIRTYVDSESPLDKAGGYGIQDHTGPLFVENLNGDYYNVVGLPLRHLYVTLQTDFPDLLTT